MVNTASGDPSSRSSTRKVFKSQMRMARSSPAAASSLPSGENATVSTAPIPAALSTRRCLPSGTPHRRTVLSALPVATVPPSGEKATQSTRSEWPSSETRSPCASSKRKPFSSCPVAARYLPSRERARPVTGPCSRSIPSVTRAFARSQSEMCPLVSPTATRPPAGDTDSAVPPGKSGAPCSQTSRAPGEMRQSRSLPSRFAESSSAPSAETATALEASSPSRRATALRESGSTSSPAAS